MVEPTGKIADDIRVGEISLDDRPLAAVLSEATVEVTVLEEARPGVARALPAHHPERHGALATTGATSTDRLAVRPGVIYTADGKARVRPAGGRLHHPRRPRVRVRHRHRPRVAQARRDASARSSPSAAKCRPQGWVACDTHVHTLTHSGHGDSHRRRAGDHARRRGHRAADRHRPQQAGRLPRRRGEGGVRKLLHAGRRQRGHHAVGHFNVFPLPADGPVADFKVKDWKGVSAAIGKAGGAAGR